MRTVLVVVAAVAAFAAASAGPEKFVMSRVFPQPGQIPLFIADAGGPDGHGLTRITQHGNFCGSPKWSADSLRVLAYCMDAEQTLDARRAVPEHADGTRLVSIDVATGATSDVPAGSGIKFNPSF